MGVGVSRIRNAAGPRVKNQTCNCTRETRADRWSSRAAFDSQAARCSSRNVWVACNGAASPGNQRAPELSWAAAATETSCG